MAKRPISAVGNRRPIADYARMAAQMGGNPRYKVMYIIYSFIHTYPTHPHPYSHLPANADFVQDTQM